MKLIRLVDRKLGWNSRDKHQELNDICHCERDVERFCLNFLKCRKVGGTLKLLWQCGSYWQSCVKIVVEKSNSYGQRFARRQRTAFPAIFRLRLYNLIDLDKLLLFFFRNYFLKLLSAKSRAFYTFSSVNILRNT